MDLKKFKQIFVGIVMLIKAGLATGIIIIVDVHLYDVTIGVWTTGNGNSYFVTTKVACAISGDANGSNLCEYTWAVAGFSLLMQIVAAFFLFVECCSGFSRWIELAIHGCLAAWWTACSIVITNDVKTTNEKGWSQENWRNAVVVMAWVAALFSFWIAFVCIVDVVHCLAGCCGDWNKAYANEKAERDAKAHHGQPCNQEMNRDEAQKAAAV